MKKHTKKHGLSALCLVLALCMAFQSVALAADVSADTSADTSVVAEEAETAESIDTGDANAAEEVEEESSASEEEEAEEGTPAEEAEADSSEEADPVEPVETDPAEEEETETEDAGSEEADSETEEAEEADALVTAQAAVSTGWVQATDDEGSTYWTFYYKENSTVTTATQAVDEVLYIPGDIAVDTTTFTKGYYYFDEDGKLVADGETTSKGFVEVLKVSSNVYLCNDSAADSGKLVQVVTTQADNANGAVLSSTMSYYSGKYAADGLHYSNGTLYTGFYRTAAGVLYYITDGSAAKYTGKFTSGTTSTYGSTTYTGDGLWYYNGKVFTGYIRRTSSDYVWVVKSGKGGTKLTGTMSKSTAYLRIDTVKKSTGDGKYYKNGKVYTGVVNSYYYAKGVKQTYKSCWKTFDSSGNVSSKSSDNTYYFTSTGKVYTSCWKNLKRNGTTYRFYFNSNGTLCKNLYKKSSAWKKKSSKLVISRGTHTATLYATYNGSYMIPTKSFVVSTSKLASNFKVGTYKLSRRQSWFTIDSTNWWYKWGTYISGSGSWVHSEQYYTKGNSKSLRISSYNNLGTNQSKQCIRMQVVNAKLIYNMRGYGSIKTVVLNQSTNSGPFGKMTITDNVDASGKLSGTKGYDPTDPLYT
ncbi:MAG: hypothetical protein LIO95_01785 [Clostridiales bacterium]|nr:hypothetical protein [Clostridiales bacterium]